MHKSAWQEVKQEQDMEVSFSLSHHQVAYYLLGEKLFIYLPWEIPACFLSTLEQVHNCG